MGDIVTYKLYIIGKVQGVGMRFFILRTAKKYGIVGSVRNLYTGQVEAIVQSNKLVIDNYIMYLKRNSPGNISEIKLEQVFDSKIYHKFHMRLF